MDSNTNYQKTLDVLTRRIKEQLPDRYSEIEEGRRNGMRMRDIEENIDESVVSIILSRANIDWPLLPTWMLQISSDIQLKNSREQFIKWLKNQPTKEKGWWMWEFHLGEEENGDVRAVVHFGCDQCSACINTFKKLLEWFAIPDILNMQVEYNSGLGTVVFMI